MHASDLPPQHRHHGGYTADSTGATPTGRTPPR